MKTTIAGLILYLYFFYLQIYCLSTQKPKTDWIIQHVSSFPVKKYIFWKCTAQIQKEPLEEDLINWITITIYGWCQGTCIAVLLYLQKVYVSCKENIRKYLSNEIMLNWFLTSYQHTKRIEWALLLSCLCAGKQGEILDQQWFLKFMLSKNWDCQLLQFTAVTVCLTQPLWSYKALWWQLLRVIPLNFNNHFIVGGLCTCFLTFMLCI